MAAERLRVDIEVSVIAPERGGRTSPIENGYRPLCVFDLDGERVTIGLCELEAPRPIEPGSTGRGRLVFDERVAEDVRRAAREGTEVDLAEGGHVIATGRVLGVS